MKRCKHVWTVLSQEILPSAYEQIKKDGQMTSFKAERIDLFNKDAIVHYGCTLCGTEKVERV